MKPSAVIFADSGPNIGLGHLRRSSAIGRALVERGFSVQLVTPDQDVAHLVARDGLDGIVGGDPDSLPDAEITIIDSYRCTHEMMARRRASGLERPRRHLQGGLRLLDRELRSLGTGTGP